MPEMSPDWAGLVTSVIVGLTIAAIAGVAAGLLSSRLSYFWKTGSLVFLLVFSLLTTIRAMLLLGPQLASDVVGAVSLVYAIEEGARGGEEVDIHELASVLESRLSQINAGVRVRRFSDRAVEILVPGTGGADVDWVGEMIQQGGRLEFRILANKVDHADIIRLARTQASDPHLGMDRSVWSARDTDARGRPFLDAQGNQEMRAVEMARWVSVARDDAPIRVPPFTDRDGNEIREIRPFKVVVDDSVLRDEGTGQLIDHRPDRFDVGHGNGPHELRFERWLWENGHEGISVLVDTFDGWDVSGNDLEMVRMGIDNDGGLAVDFRLTDSGARRMQGLTGMNLPDVESGFGRRLGIILDGQLLTAPTIRGTIAANGQISGKFSKEEVWQIVEVLQAGRLPAALEGKPLSVTRLEPATIAGHSLGIVMAIEWIAVGIAVLGCVAVFRLTGLLAASATILNMLMLFGTLSMLNLTFTVPVIAVVPLSVLLALTATVPIGLSIRRLAKSGMEWSSAALGYSRRSLALAVGIQFAVAFAVAVHCAIENVILPEVFTLLVGIVTALITTVFGFATMLDIVSHWVTGNPDRPLGAILLEDEPDKATTVE